MNEQEACKKRIPRIRRSKWANPNAYLRMPLLADGLSGPWAELYDDDAQERVLGIRPGSQRILMIVASDVDDFEVYTGPVSPHEQDPENYAHGYLES